MSAEERVSVKTTVPQYQKDAWREHADALDMSQSEFVRTMVQAGRRGFEVEPPKPPSPDANPRGNALREAALESLSDGPLEFGEILDELDDDLEALVDDTLQSLQEAGLVQHSGREGYTLTGGNDGHD